MHCITLLLVAFPTLTTGVAPPAGTPVALFGWQPVDASLLICLPVLLVASGFFSGSETALFGMSESERMTVGRETLTHRAIRALLADQRMLLITVLIGNMTVNVMYFVISSVLLMHCTAGTITRALLAAAFLFVVIVLGEVAPKTLASSGRVRFATVCAPLLFTIHRGLGPLRIAIDRLVVSPLSRLTAPQQAPPELSDDEIQMLVEISGRAGVLNEDEHRMLRDVVGIGRLKIGDIMTPRIRMTALPEDATRNDVREATRTGRLTKIPIYGEDIDHVRGLLHVKRFLLDDRITSVTDPAVMSKPRFVPDVATLDQLLDHFRRSGTQSAIVVDEYGGTEGIVSVEDVVEEFVGDIVGADEEIVTEPRLIGLGRWLVHGDAPIGSFASAFSVRPPTTAAATVGAFIAESLGRIPEVGNVVTFETIRIEVEAVARNRVQAVVVTTTEEGEG